MSDTGLSCANQTPLPAPAGMRHEAWARSDFALLPVRPPSAQQSRNLERVVDLDTKVPNRALQLGMAEQQPNASFTRDPQGPRLL
jgi:hypothetical protein